MSAEVKKRKPAPFPFVLDALSSAAPFTRPMFGCLSLYVDEKIVLILRDKPEYPRDNGVWLATERDHHESLRREFPNMRSLSLFGESQPSNWQLLPVDAPDFEASVLHACELVLDGDPRIGRVPKPRTKRKKR